MHKYNSTTGETNTGFPKGIVGVWLRKNVFLWVENSGRKLRLSISLHDDGKIEPSEQVALFKLFKLINLLLEQK